MRIENRLKTYKNAREMNPQIKRYKEEFHQIEQALKLYPSLLKKREDLDNAISQLEKELAKKFLNSAQSTVDKAKALLSDLKKQRNEIDQLLDESEEFSEERSIKIKESLIALILKEYPDQQEVYQKLFYDFEVCLEKENSLLKVIDICQSMSHILEKAIEVRKSIKGSGILRYIFGISPNAEIEHQFRMGLRHAKESIPFLSQRKHDAEILLLFQHLEKQFQKPWSFSHLDSIYASSHQKLQLFINQLQRQLEENQQTKASLEKSMNDWLDQY